MLCAADTLLFFHNDTLTFFNFHYFTNISGKSDKKLVESGCGGYKRAKGKEIVPVVSPGKSTSNTEGEVLDVGNVALPNGDVIDLSDRSAGLKSPPELIGAPSPPKK